MFTGNFVMVSKMISRSSLIRITEIIAMIRAGHVLTAAFSSGGYSILERCVLLVSSGYADVIVSIARTVYTNGFVNFATTGCK